MSIKSSADFRSHARAALRGRWGLAVIAGLLASLLGGTGASGPEINLDFSDSGFNFSLNYADQPLFSTGGSGDSALSSMLLSIGVVYIALFAIVIAIGFLILGSVIEIGYSRFNLNLIHFEGAKYGDLFSYFPYWRTTTISRLLRGIYIFLWSLLLLIPGIIAHYSYAMTGYILAEYPELTASEAIQRSKEMMRGNRIRLFCLELSFIGWGILCIFTLGIGNLWLTPYTQAAKAAFYQDIAKTAYTNTYTFS